MKIDEVFGVPLYIQDPTAQAVSIKKIVCDIVTVADSSGVQILVLSSPMDTDQKARIISSFAADRLEKEYAARDKVQNESLCQVEANPGPMVSKDPAGKPTGSSGYPPVLSRTFPSLGAEASTKQS